MFKMIVSDLDGTLIQNPKEGLSQGFITKIKKLTDCGTIFVLNSGRTYSDLKGIAKKLLNRTVFICNDGTQIMYKNCLIYKSFVTQRQIADVYSLVLAEGLEIFGCMREKNIPLKKEMAEQGFKLFEEVYKLVIIKKSGAPLKDIKEKAQEVGLRVCFEDERYLELCQKSADKGTATQYVKDRFGIKTGVVVFGDGENDIPMFQKADEVYIVKGKNKVYYQNAKHIENAQTFIIENL